MRKQKIDEKDGFYLVNKENGEITGSFGEGDMIIRKESIEHNMKYDDKFYDGKEFLKVFPSAVPILAKKLTASEFGFLFQLSPYISYKDNILRYGGEILDLEKLATYMGNYTYNAVQKIVSSLIRKGVLGVHKTGCMDRPSIMIKCYTVNPFIIGKGNTIDRTIVGLFEKSGWNSIEEYKIKKDETEKCAD